MNRIKTNIAILVATLALTSCQQEYNCVCSYRPGAMQIASTPRYTIKAKNATQAATKCDAKETTVVECSIQ